MRSKSKKIYFKASRVQLNTLKTNFLRKNKNFKLLPNKKKKKKKISTNSKRSKNRRLQTMKKEAFISENKNKSHRKLSNLKVSPIS